MTLSYYIIAWARKKKKAVLEEQQLNHDQVDSHLFLMVLSFTPAFLAILCHYLNMPWPLFAILNSTDFEPKLHYFGIC